MLQRSARPRKRRASAAVVTLARLVVCLARAMRACEPAALTALRD